MKTVVDFLIDITLGESCDKKIERIKQDIMKKSKFYTNMIIQINDFPGLFENGPRISEYYRFSEQNHFWMVK